MKKSAPVRPASTFQSSMERFHVPQTKLNELKDFVWEFHDVGTTIEKGTGQTLKFLRWNGMQIRYVIRVATGEILLLELTDEPPPPPPPKAAKLPAQRRPSSPRLVKGIANVLLRMLSRWIGMYKGVKSAAIDRVDGALDLYRLWWFGSGVSLLPGQDRQTVPGIAASGFQSVGTTRRHLDLQISLHLLEPAFASSALRKLLKSKAKRIRRNSRVLDTLDLLPPTGSLNQSCAELTDTGRRPDIVLHEPFRVNALLENSYFQLDGLHPRMLKWTGAKAGFSTIMNRLESLGAREIMAQLRADPRLANRLCH